MATRPALLCACLLACALVPALGCGSGSGNAPSGGADEADDRGVAPLLGSEHHGTKSTHCDACHVLPTEDHVADRSPECATCHGGNGACDPNGLFSLRDHDEMDACTACHTGRHGYTDDADCAACHFAASGLDETYGEPVDDSGGGPGQESKLRPETELVEGCYGWPGTEFTPEGAAQRRFGLAAGEAAVDFTLATPSGTAVSLADLLKDRPVALVTGGFT